jgi:hypothetical protein
LQDDTSLWLQERRVRFRGNFCKPVASADGRRVAVYRVQHELAVDILFASSENCLGTQKLLGRYNLPFLHFLPGNSDAIVLSETKVLWAYNFLTYERKSEAEVDCGSVAVQSPMFTVLM